MLTLLMLFLVLKCCLRQKRKSLRQDAAEGSSVVVGEGFELPNKTKAFSAIERIGVLKRVLKDFCLPSKSHFYNLPISSPGDCFTRRIFSYTLQKLGVFGAGA